MKLWLSILLPTYNGTRYLPWLIENLRREPLEGVEVLAVDDGSDDDTPAILARAREQLPLRILEGPRKGNWVASTNVALREARGEFACFLHQDDGYLPGRLNAIRSLVGRFPAAALYTHAARYVDDAGRVLGTWRAPLGAGVPLDSSHVRQRLLVQNFFAIAAPAFRTADALRLGGLDEDLWYTADWDFWLKLTSVGPTVYLPDALALFRVHAASQTVRRSRDPEDFRHQMLRVVERHLPGLEADTATRDSVQRASHMAIEANVALASLIHRTPLDAARLWRAMRDLDASGTRRFLRDSRLFERVGARVRATLRAAQP